MDRYGVDSEDPLELLELIGRRRGLLMKGGNVNIRGAAIAVIRDWILGKLIYYYRPPTRSG